MQFAVLGPLQVVAGDCEEPRMISAARLRALLAVLLWRANQPVPADELAELVWDGAPPVGTVEATRALVMRLRRQLDNRIAARIVTRPAGYVIEVSGDELDAARFEALAKEAGAAARAGRWAQAARTAGQALRLWRGVPLADVPSQLLRDQWVPHLEQLHVQALDWRIEGELREGHHEQLIPELRELTSRHPLREGLHGQLMLALYRCGRQAEALAAYQRARDVLVGELGVEPGPGLRDLHQRILSADPELAATAPPADAGPARSTPRELPAVVPGFTGRSAELAVLTGLLDRGGAQAAVVITAIGGTAGVGKTALAVQWAHQVAGRFPDGQLYVNLRGYDLGAPVPAAEALAGFLRSLGVPGADIPPDLDGRAARYRSLLAGRRVLVLADNAGSADQVRPLLPGTAGCTVVVTSRDALAGLAARDGAARVGLDVLPDADAVGLLRALIGARVDADPAAAGLLARQCCRLPLALRVAAELAAARPGAPLGVLAGELADLGTRLDLLAAGGDARAQVRAVFSWSCRQLEAAQVAVFGLLGLHPGPDFEVYAAAALTGSGVAAARAALEVLARAHLIAAAGPGRYAMHDLLRAYAAELDVADQRQAALTRLFDHYLHTAATAMDTLLPAEQHRRPRIPRPDSPVPALPDPVAARQWLDAERAALVAAVAHTAANDWPGHATRLAATIAGYLVDYGHLPEALTVSGQALDAARRTDDRAAEAEALSQLADVAWEHSRYRQVADYHRQALALSRAAGVRASEARALGGMGLAEAALGHHEQGARSLTEAVAINRGIGDRLGEARALGNLGLIRRRQGRYQEAAGYYQQSLDLARELGDRQGEAWSLGRLGSVDLRLGRYEQAAGYLQQALALFREIGTAGGEAQTLSKLGEIDLGLGRYEQAFGNFEQALAMSREIGDPVMEADALNGLGAALFHTGQLERAREQHTIALRLASAADSPLEEAGAHCGLARACQAGGDLARARHHWREALTRYAAIGAPEAGEIRARLAGIGDHDDDDQPACEQAAPAGPAQHL